MGGASSESTSARAAAGDPSGGRGPALPWARSGEHVGRRALQPRGLHGALPHGLDPTHGGCGGPTGAPHGTGGRPAMVVGVGSHAGVHPPTPVLHGPPAVARAVRGGRRGGAGALGRGGARGAATALRHGPDAARVGPRPLGLLADGPGQPPDPLLSGSARLHPPAGPGPGGERRARAHRALGDQRPTAAGPGLLRRGLPLHALPWSRGPRCRRPVRPTAAEGASAAA